MNPRHPLKCPHCRPVGTIEDDSGLAWRAYRCGDLSFHWDNHFYHRAGMMLCRTEDDFRGGTDQFFLSGITCETAKDYRKAYALACRAGLIDKTLADRILQ
jgi:hypothetical protein